MAQSSRPYKDSDESVLVVDEDCLPPVDSLRQQLELNLAASSALKVYVRLRPRVGGKPFPNPAIQPRNDTTVETTTATAEHQQQKRFSFTKVFTELTSQGQVFEEAVRCPLDAFVDGKNVLLFAYGPTASGKTHTMQGPPTDPGIVPRTLDRLFKLLGSQVCKGAPVRPDCFDDVVPLDSKGEAAVLALKQELLAERWARSAADFSTFHLPSAGEDSSSLFASRFSDESRSSSGAEVMVWLSFYEIYNEGLYDLLISAAPSTKKARGGRRVLLKLGVDRAKRSFVRGLVEVPVCSADEAHRLLCLARHNQSVAETSLNRSSSRSHCVFTVRLVCSLGEGRSWRVSTLMLCDLAGSERASKTGAGGSRLREAGRINTSLMVLSRCLEGLRQNRDSAAKQVPVPFRESKLTQVMQAFFTTGGHISLVVNICPALSMLEESLNALKFSAVACEVIPVQLETRRERCDRAVRRLTELWQRSSHGEARRDTGAAVADVDNALLDEGDVEELFDTIQVLEKELAETQAKLKWSERMASAHEAKCKEYEEMVTALEQTKRMIWENGDREMAVRVRSACEITRMEMYRQAEAGSTMELLGRCEEAERRVALLEKRLRAQLTDEAPQQDLVAVHDRSTPVVVDQGTQTDEVTKEDSRDEKSLAALSEWTAAMEAAEAAKTAELSRMQDEAEKLRHSVEKLREELAHEVQARCCAEDAAREASSRLANIAQELAEQVSSKEELERSLKDAQRLASEAHSRELEELRQELGQRNHELEALRQQYTDKVEALKAAESKMERNAESHYRQLEEWCSWRDETARDLEKAESKVRDLEGDLEEKAGMVATLEEKCRALEADAKESRKSAHKAAEALRKAESRLKAAEQELRVCRQELLASEEARVAASRQVEAKEEELSQLRTACQPTLAEIEEEDRSKEPDENCQPRTRRTGRTTRARKTRTASVALEAPDDDDFETPRRVTRSRKQSAALQPEGTAATTPSRRSILGEPNTGSSPLQRFSDMVSSVLSRASRASAAPSEPSSRKRRPRK